MTCATNSWHMHETALEMGFGFGFVVVTKKSTKYNVQDHHLELNLVKLVSYLVWV